MALKSEFGSLRKGDVLKGRYEILSLIGEGGMSRVYLAADLELTNKQWAVKEVSRNMTDPTGRPIEQTLAGEAELLSKIDHPNIVDIVDIEKTDEYIYVVMDHVEGVSLDKLVRDFGAQSEEDVAHWMGQLCSALGYLHSQDPPIIYRDMKPGNIMLHTDGYVKLIDFGVSREYKDDKNKDTTVFVTNGYAAPEQFGKAQTDARADIYGLGACMWHLLAGEAPPGEFPLPNVRTRNPGVGEGFADVIIPKCTEINRERRYSSCEELASDISCYPELTREYRSKQKRKVLAFAAPLAAAVILLVFGFTMLGLRHSTIEENYESFMSNARTADDPALAAAQYYQAATIRPDAGDAYIGLIGSFEADEAFDASTPAITVDGGEPITEKQLLDRLYQANLGQLEASNDFARVSYELGRLYWYFSSYGQTGSYEDNQLTRIKASAPYFEDASKDPSFENQSTAATYASIADFASKINNAIRMGGETEELYGDYWKNLSSLVDNAASERQEAVKLDSCLLAISAIETYLSKFKEYGGIERASVEELCDKVDGLLSDMAKSSKGTSESLRSNLADRLADDIPTKIATVYGQESAASDLSSDADAAYAAQASIWQSEARAEEPVSVRPVPGSPMSGQAWASGYMMRAA